MYNCKSKGYELMQRRQRHRAANNGRLLHLHLCNGLLNWDIRILAMHVIEVNVVNSQAFERRKTCLPANMNAWRYSSNYTEQAVDPPIVYRHTYCHPPNPPNMVPTAIHFGTFFGHDQPKFSGDGDALSRQAYNGLSCMTLLSVSGVNQQC